MMILFVIICVIVLSSLSYRRPMRGWYYYSSPLFFGAHRHHRPMGPRPFARGPHHGPAPFFGGPHHGPGPMHGPRF